MISDYITDKFNVVHYGIYQCEPKHSFGPGLRDHYILVVVLDGKGIYQTERAEYKLGKHDVFLIRPKEIHFYQADEKDPWYYAWISFYTDYEFFKDFPNPIFHCHNLELIKECIALLDEGRKLKVGYNTRSMGCLYLFLSEIYESNIARLVRINDLKTDYIAKALKYIEGNYHRKMTVNEIADYVCLERSYFTNIFKRYIKMSPQEYIIDYRLKKACQYLLDTNLSVERIAHSLGYHDSLNFSRLFKKKIGKAPTQYREDYLKSVNINSN